ncbi:MAG: hypothetical protein E6Q97_16600 [Desulfurellales bacterium]|nr:MAG: hypothetical protein E6Q97_16600 [Desulfurellales bacterium]
MPNAVDTATAKGWTTLKAKAGETVTFRGADVVVVIDRFTPELPDDPRRPDLKPREQSMIEIDDGAVSPNPKAGEIFTDSEGKRHKCIRIRPVGGTIRLLCDIYPEP